MHRHRGEVMHCHTLHGVAHHLQMWGSVRVIAKGNINLSTGSKLLIDQVVLSNGQCLINVLLDYVLKVNLDLFRIGYTLRGG